MDRPGGLSLPVDRTIKLTLAYDGTEFHGWQIQPREPTIQAAVMDAVEHVTGERVPVAGSGRTDAGVHALAQVASFRTPSNIPVANLLKALNRRLPFSIRVLKAEDVAPEFHARFHARAKTYRYRLYRGEICPPLLWRYVHHFSYRLDEAAMIRAAPLFEGRHDFTSMASSAGRGAADPEKAPEKSRVRALFSSHLAREGDELVYTVRGSGFLHHMVRNIVGTLLEVGKGRMAVEQVPEILEARRRSAGGPALPGKGLCLVSVEYDIE